MEPNEIVRRFSVEAAVTMPTEPLAQALGHKVASDENEEKKKDMRVNLWQNWFVDKPRTELKPLSTEEQVLDKAGKELAKSWKRFQETLPVDQRSRIEDEPPDVAMVWDAVRVAENSWQTNRKESRSGRAKAKFAKVCRSLDDHKDLFGIFPSSDKYVTLITGSISAVVKATINHEDIANGISEILDDVWDDTRLLNRLIPQHVGNEFARRYVANFYTELFKLLSEVFINWYRSPVARFVHSFNCNYLKQKVGESSRKMKVLIGKMKNELDLAMWAKLSSLPTKDYINLKFEELGITLHSLLGMNVQAQRIQGFNNAGEPYNSGTALPSMIEDTQRAGAIDESNSISEVETDPEVELLKCPMLEDKKRALHLQIYLQDDYLATLKQWAQGLSVNVEVFHDVQRWAMRARSSCLWVEGPANTESPSQNTLMSVSILNTIHSLRIPVVSHFCRQSFEYQTKSPASSELVSMVYSLIYQLIQQFPDESDCPKELDLSRLAALDGSIASLPDAISLLETLFSHGPAAQFCLINGLQILDSDMMDNEQTAHLIRFIRVLYTASAWTGHENKMVKVLFTTDGYTNLLGFPAGGGFIGRSCYVDDVDTRPILAAANIHLMKIDTFTEDKPGVEDSEST